VNNIFFQLRGAKQLKKKEYYVHERIEIATGTAVDTCGQIELSSLQS
jgi:hypothetical protein